MNFIFVLETSGAFGQIGYRFTQQASSKLVRKRFEEDQDVHGEGVHLLGKTFKWDVLNDSGEKTDELIFFLEGTDISQFNTFHLGKFFKKLWIYTIFSYYFKK